MKKLTLTGMALCLTVSLPAFANGTGSGPPKKSLSPIEVLLDVLVDKKVTNEKGLDRKL